MEKLIKNQNLDNFSEILSYTYSHCKDVANYTKILAKEIGLKDLKVEQIINAAFLHDIGKIFIPHTILHKPDRLTKEEFEVMKKHPEIGANILKKANLDSKYLEVVLYHHERYDGRGYPRGLKGDEIPLDVRIITIADSFDAMTSNRPYRQAMKEESALIELQNNAGTQFDSYLVKKFIKAIKRKKV